MAMVIDASVAIAWLLEDEDTSDTVASLAAAEDVETFVPQLWHFEIRNALLNAERRRRLHQDQMQERLHYLNALPVKTDSEPDLEAAMALARHHHLTFYDALYLELAKRRNAHIATLDKTLAAAASHEDVLMTV